MILVIGASGFVGRHLVARLAEQMPGKVRAFVRPGSSYRVPQGVERVEGDILKPDSLKAAMQGVDTVCHMAAITANIKGDYTKYDQINHIGTQNAVTAAAQAGVSRFILGSGLGTVEGAPGSYMRTRWDMEQAVCSSTDLNWTIFQPSIVFGQGSEFFEAQARIIKLAPFAPIIGGKIKVQPLWIEDYITIIVQSLDDPKTYGKSYSFGGPEIMTYRDAIHIIKDSLGTRKPDLPLPLWFMQINAAAMSVLPKPPLTSATLQLFAFDNAAEANGVQKNFGFAPRSVREYYKDNPVLPPAK